MLLFQKRFHAGLVSGAITITFRYWERPHVKPGGRYRCHPIGVLEVDRIERLRVGAISDVDALRAGFSTRAELLDYIGQSMETEIYRIELRHGGDGDRVALALKSELSDGDIAAIRTKLEALDARAPGPWTRRALTAIEKQPRVAASQLAKKLGFETEPFKANIVKLKKLGLTQSFEVGYEIAPRGRSYLNALGKARAPKPAPASRERGRERRAGSRREAP